MLVYAGSDVLRFNSASVTNDLATVSGWNNAFLAAVV